MAISEWWDTTKLCETFNVTGACSMLIETGDEVSRNRPFTGGMTGHKHSEETRQKMSKSMTGLVKPGLHKGGSLVSPSGEVVHFTTISWFCQEHGLSTGHVSEVLSGKRRSVKGWVKP